MPREPTILESPRRGKVVDIDYRSLAELRHQIRKFLTFSEQEARAAGLEPQQHQLLLAVKGLPESERPTVSALAERLRLRHHTVVGMVDRLVAAKLAVRRPSKVDGREILVALTARGEGILRTLALLHRAELQTAAPALIAALEAIVGEQRSKTILESPRRGTTLGSPRKGKAVDP